MGVGYKWCRPGGWNPYHMTTSRSLKLSFMLMDWQFMAGEAIISITLQMPLRIYSVPSLPSRMSDDDDYDAADSGAADCTPIEAGSVKMGKFRE